MALRGLLAISAILGIGSTATATAAECEPEGWIETSDQQTAEAAASRPARTGAIRLFLAAQRAANSGDPAAVATALDDIISAGAPVLPGPQSPVAAFADEPQVARPLAALRQRICPTKNGARLIDLPQAGVAAEGIAWDPVTQRLFLSDWNSNAILRTTLDGKPETYFKLPSLTPNGIAIDAARRILWFVATDAFRDGTADPQSALWRIDLDTGTAEIVPALGRAGFNDLTIAPDGTIYISDTPGGHIWAYVVGTGGLQVITSADDRLNSPNGLAVDGSGRYLYVGQGLDPVRIALGTREIEALELPPGVETMGTDGLYWRDGHLFAIQNFLTPGHVAEFDLADDGLRVERHRVLERASDVFDLPTTGTFVGDRFVVLATTGLYRFGAGKQPGPDHSQALTVLSYDLER